MKILLMSMLVLSMTTAHASVTPTELVVKMKAGKSLPNFGKNSKVQNLFGNVYIVRNNDVTSLEKQLKNNSDIEYTERNYRAEKSPLPSPVEVKTHTQRLFQANLFNDPKVDRIWSFNDAAQNGVSVNAAYKLHGTSATETIIVAVVDTGIDYGHEDLKDVLWINEKEIPANGIDDDNNGYVDDVYGINTLVRDSSGRATGNNRDTHSHGTHVAGTIGAKQNNGVGIAGIASNVKIIGIKTVPNNGDETDVDVAESFIYAAKNGAKIINCSFGKRRNEGNNLIPETLKYIEENYGVLVIAAAGNDGSDIDKKPTYPASHQNENLLIVASTTKSGSMSSFSNYAKLSVDVAAPGSDVYSTTPGNRYASMSGTSMASPTTAGVAAEILSHNPHLSPAQLKKVMMDSVTTDARYNNKMITGGRVDLLKGLELARTIK